MLTWHFITRSTYNSMQDSLKTSDKLFFIKDENIILNGSDEFNEEIILYNRNPSTILSNKIYININTLEGIICAGNSWVGVIDPVIVNRDDYLNSYDIKYISYNAEYNNLLVVKIDDTTDSIELSDITIDINYSDGKFTILNEACHLSYGRKILIEDFIDDITYNNGILTLVFTNSNSALNINIGIALNSNNNINFTLTGNAFIAECVLYENSSNTIHTDSMYTVYRNTNNTSSIDITKSVISSITGFLATITNSNVNIMTTVGFNRADEIILADDEGNAKASGVTITDTISDTPSNSRVATEKAIVEYVENTTLEKKDVTTHNQFQYLTSETASDRRLVSERALFEQLNWDVV